MKAHLAKQQMGDERESWGYTTVVPANTAAAAAAH